MADHVLESRMWCARPRAEVFAVVADPALMPRLAVPAWNVRLVTAAPVMAAGAVLDFDVSWLGLPIRWRAFVREWDPPYRFVTVQVRGPWARWEHRRRLLEADGGTTVEDRLTYRPPLGALGHVAHALVLQRQLRAGCAHRRAQLAGLLGPVRPEAG